jgi:hypothetical protein
MGHYKTEEQILQDCKENNLDPDLEVEVGSNIKIGYITITAFETTGNEVVIPKKKLKEETCPMCKGEGVIYK